MPAEVVTVSPRTLSSGAKELPSVNKRGELVLMPWHVQLVNEGRVFTCGVGSETTPISSNVNTAIDEDQPEFLLRVPTGTTIIPLSIHAYYEATGAAIAEGGAAISDSDPGSGTSSALTRTPTNLKPRGALSACTGAQIVTANLTLTNSREFWRFGEPADLDGTVTGNSGFRWDYNTHSGVPVLVGPGALQVYVTCGTSASIFLTVIYAEFLTAELE